MVKLNNSWDDILKDEFKKDYYIKLREKLKYEYKNYTIYPDMYHIFEAFKQTDYKNVKVVILGQDPYHEPMQAHGLAFSVNKNVKIPPSLINIYKELKAELGCYIPSHGNLTEWAKQGVLLLNTSLTVRRASAASHKGLGWEIFTDDVISILNLKDTPIVFMLWGAHAISKKNLIDNPAHLILSSPHPSPLSANRGFFGNGHFKTANRFLEENGMEKIDWQIHD